MAKELLHRVEEDILATAQRMYSADEVRRRSELIDKLRAAAHATNAAVIHRAPPTVVSHSLMRNASSTSSEELVISLGKLHAFFHQRVSVFFTSQMSRLDHLSVKMSRLNKTFELLTKAQPNGTMQLKNRHRSRMEAAVALRRWAMISQEQGRFLNDSLPSSGYTVRLPSMTDVAAQGHDDRTVISMVNADQVDPVTSIHKAANQRGTELLERLSRLRAAVDVCGRQWSRHTALLAAMAKEDATSFISR